MRKGEKGREKEGKRERGKERKKWK